MESIKDLISKKYLVKTVQMALYDNDTIDMLGAPISTHNGNPTDNGDNVMVEKKVTMVDIIRIYQSGLYLSILPRSAFFNFTKDVVKVLDYYHSGKSYNQRVAINKTNALGVTVDELKKFYSKIMSTNGKLVEYSYNKPELSSFDLGIDDSLVTAEVKEKVSSKEIVRNVLNSTGSNMGTDFNYRTKGKRKQNEIYK